MAEQVVIGEGANKVLLNASTATEAGTAWHVIAKDKTFLIFHAAGAGSTVIMEGSNDPRVLTDLANSIWVTIRDTGDPSAVTLISSASGAGATQAGFSNNEPWKWIRANKTASAGGASTVILGT